MTEKTNAEVLEESASDEEVSTPAGGVTHQDKLILLDNGSLLITRLLPTKNQAESTFICMYKPLEIFADAESGEVMVREWIPESVDEFFYVPVIKVTNVSKPDPFFLSIYHKQLHPQAADGTPQVVH
jgi:hypothetical protein